MATRSITMARSKRTRISPSSTSAPAVAIELARLRLQHPHADLLEDGQAHFVDRLHLVCRQDLDRRVGPRQLLPGALLRCRRSRAGGRPGLRRVEVRSMALLLGWKDHAAPMVFGAREQFQEKWEPVFRPELRENKQMDRRRVSKPLAAGQRSAGEPEEARPTSEKREQAMGASHLLHDRTTRLVRTRTEGNGRTGAPAFNAVAEGKASRSACRKTAA